MKRTRTAATCRAPKPSPIAEPLEDRIAPASLATLTAGSVSVQGDQGSAGEADVIHVSILDADLHFTDSGGGSITAGTGFTQNGSSDVFVPLSSFTGTLSVNTGTGADQIVIDSALSLPGDTTLASGGSVTFNAGLTLATTKNLTTTAVGTIALANASADLSATGTGSISLTTARDITLASGASVTTVNGNLTLNANQQTTATSGSFVGIDINAASVQSSGTGQVSVLGRGGDSGGSQIGIRVQGGGSILGGTAGTTTVTGTGGASATAGATGVNVFGSGSTINSGGADVTITGTGGSSSTAGGLGIDLYTSAHLSAGGSGNLTIVGTGGTATTSSFIHGIILSSSTLIDSAGGNVSVTGTGGTGSGGSSDFTGIEMNDSTITAGSMGSVTVAGTGGNATSSQTTLGIDVRFTAQITSAGGNVSVTGTGGNSTNASIGTAAGIRLIGNGAITAGGTGTVTVSGIGIGGSSVGHEGIVIDGQNLSSNLAKIGAANGATSVTAVAGNGSSYALRIGGTNAGRIVTGSNNPITISADTINIATAGSISSGTAATSIAPSTAGTQINLGGADVLAGSPRTLGLDATELGKITSSALNIGTGTAGALTVSAALSFTKDLSLSTGNTLAVNQSLTLAANKALSAVAAGNLTVGAAGTISAGGNVTLSSGSDATISASITKPTGTDSTLTIQANNNVSFDSSADVGVSGGGRFHVVLNSDRDASGVGRIVLHSGTTIDSNGGNIALGGGLDPLVEAAYGGQTGNDNHGIELDGAQIISGAGAIRLRGHGGNVTTGQTNDGVRLANGALLQTSTGGITIFGNGGTGSGSIDNHVGVSIETGADVISTGSGAITITGVAGAGASRGISVENVGSSIDSQSTGPISLYGTGGTVGAEYGGFSMKQGGAVLGGGGAGILIEVDSAAGADSFVLISTAGMISGTGSLTIQPKVAGTTIGLGTGSTGVLNLDDSELGKIGSTFTSVTFGSTIAGAVSTSSAAALSFGNSTTIQTGAGVSFNHGVTMAANKSLTVTALGTSNGTIGLTTANADLSATGTGSISLTTARDISMLNGSSITTVNGALTLSANQQVTPTSGFFTGLKVNGGLVQVTGTGALTVAARGGDDFNGQLPGIDVTFSGAIVGGTSGTATIQGLGGPSVGSFNYGVLVEYAGSISSGGANVVVTGTGGGTGGASSLNNGVYLFDNGVIAAGGTGTLTINGTAGTGGGQGVFAATFGVGAVTQITSGGGDITINGTTTAAFFYGINLSNSSSSISTATNGGNIVLNADSLSLNGPVSANASGTITLLPQTTGTRFDLGGNDVFTGSPLTVGLDSTELANISAGTLSVGNANTGTIAVSTAISLAAGLTLTSPAGISLGGNISTDAGVFGGAITFNGPATLGASVTLDSDHATGADGAIAFNGNIALGNRTLTLNSGAANSTIAGVISGTGGLTKQGTGNLTLSGSSANTYSGLTTITGGTLILQKTAGVNAIAGNVVIGDQSGNDTLQLGASNQIADTSVIQFNSGGTGNSAKFTLAGFSETVAGIQSLTTGQLPIIQAFDDGSSGSSTLTINAATDYTFDGAIRNNGAVGTATLSLVKAGAGTLTLADSESGAKITYSGSTSVQGGRLVLDNLGAFSSAISLSNALPDALTFSQSANPLSYSRPISGTGAITILGNVPVTLGSGASTFAGTVTIRGEAIIATNGALGAATNDVIVDGNGRLTVNGTITSARHFIATGADPSVQVNAPYALTLTGMIDGSLRKLGQGKLLFGGAFQGAVELPAGTSTTTVGTQTVNLLGQGTMSLGVMTGSNGKPRIANVELADTTEETYVTINSVGTGITYVDRIMSMDVDSSIGTIKLGTNVVLGNGMDDGIVDVDIRGKVDQILFNDVSAFAIVEIGKGLPYNIEGDDTTPDTYNNRPDVTLRNVLGDGVVIDLTGNGIPGNQPGSLGGGGLGKVVASYWPGTGTIKTTQGIASFTLSRGDCQVDFRVDEFHVGALTTAGIGSISVPKGTWASTGSIVEGTVEKMSVRDFAEKARLKVGAMGTLSVAGDFKGIVDVEGSARSITVGRFSGSLQAGSIGKLTAEYFDGYDPSGSDPYGDPTRRNITVTSGGLGLITAKPHDLDKFGIRGYEITVAGKFDGFAITDKTAPAGFVGIDRVFVQAGVVGTTNVTLTGAPTVLAIKDSVLQSNGAMGTITASHGVADSIFAAATSIAQLTMKANVTNSKILAGTFLGADGSLGGSGDAADSFSRSGTIAGVAVKGAFLSSTIAAGIDPVNGIYGDADDRIAQTGTAPGATVKAIGAIVLGPGSGVFGTSTGTHTSLIAALSIKSLTAAGKALTPLSVGLSKYLDLGPVGEDAGDVRIRIMS